MEKRRIIAATNNRHKVEEFKQILGGGFEIVSANEAGICIEPEENGETFYENALIKAKAVYNEALSPVIADDSGLKVYCLNGAPGVRSARYAGENANDEDNNLKLLAELKEKKDRRAAFVCTLVYYDGKRIITAEGTTEGEILSEYRGKGGFGYDPLFYCYALKKTFGEAEPQEKNSVSHRGKALEELKQKLW